MGAVSLALDAAQERLFSRVDAGRGVAV
jgi:hypothetical protein